MASVQINIPGIGNVVADNASTEETLQKILAAIQKQGAGGGAGAGKRKEDDVLKKAKEEEIIHNQALYLFLIHSLMCNNYIFFKYHYIAVK
jgi:hypothetical protein